MGAASGTCPTSLFYYDGVNEILETSADGETLFRWHVNGVSYIDERPGGPPLWGGVAMIDARG